MTLPEVLLWEQLRGQKQGFKVRKQHPFGDYVADFCCLSAKLVIEIDGEAHSRGDASSRDDRRDAFFAQRGFHVLRVTAKDVLNNMDGVLQLLRLTADSPLHHASGAVPLPASGEEF